jgi:hypothetical protein
MPNYSGSLGTYLLAKRWGKGWRESEEEANKEKKMLFLKSTSGLTRKHEKNLSL